MWFQNVQIEKNPLGLWMMQQIIYETRPEFIVETGTWMGGSALYWAYTLNGLGLTDSRVITVDLQDFTKTAAQHDLWKKYDRAIVCLDSDHRAAHTFYPGGWLHRATAQP